MLKAPMIIDLSKARKAKAALHAAESALGWQGWNNANPLHPKGADGRWVSGHPGVADLGRMHEHVGGLSDEDVHAAYGHAQGLTSVLEDEIRRRNGLPGDVARAEKRRGYSAAMFGDEPLPGSHAWREKYGAGIAKPVMPNPGKLLRASSGRGKVVAPEVSAELDEMVRRPMPGDRERMKSMLSGLTVPQIHEFVGRHMDTPATGKTKKDLISGATDHTIGFKLNSEAIRHGTYSSADFGAHDPKAARLAEINTEMKAADLRGDRAEYERLHNERLALRGGYELEPGAGPNKPAESGTGFGDHLREKRINDLTSKINDPGTSAVDKKRLREDRATLAGPAMFGNTPEDLAAQLKNLPATSAGQAQAREMLQGMTVPQLKKLRGEIGDTVSKKGTTKRQIIEDIQEGTVGFRARAGVMGEGMTPEQLFGTGAAPDGLDIATKGSMMAQYSGKGPRIHNQMTKSEMAAEIRRWRAQDEPKIAVQRAVNARENEPYIKHLEQARKELPDRNYGTAVDEILAKMRSGEYDRWAAYNHAGTSKVMRTDMGPERAQGHRVMDEFRALVEASEEDAGPKA